MPLEQHRSPLEDAVRHFDSLEVYWLFLARKKTLANQEQNLAHHRKLPKHMNSESASTVQVSGLSLVGEWGFERN